MMTRILAHQRDLGNGVGLHYSGFRRFSAFPASPNQLLALSQPRENRRHRPPIREVGLGASRRDGPSRRELAVFAVLCSELSAIDLQFAAQTLARSRREGRNNSEENSGITAKQ
jgi:hypothetical protein